jgi:hypothetical protein
MYRFLLLLIVCAGWDAAAAEPEKPTGSKDVIVWLRVIDKLTATPHELRVSVGTVANYQTLSILPKRCSVNDEGQYAALLEVYDQPPAGGTQELFSGWMFSASPSLSHIEHPFYDVSLVSCVPRAAEKAKAAKPKKEVVR